MCLAAPMQIKSILPNGRARAEREGLSLEIDLSLIEAPREGDFVIVHAGYAIETLDLEDAEQRRLWLQELQEPPADGDP